MKNNKPIFVFVHGAWHGGWVWKEVAGLLAYQGYNVTCPTQTGLGERKHLLSSEITIDTFIEDIVNHIISEDLENIVLVGHSFAGSTISGVVDRLKDRINRLIYFDAMVLSSGQSPFDVAPDEVVKERIALAAQSEGKVSVAPPEPEVFGVFDIRKSLILAKKLTPHPISTFQSQLKLKNKIGNGVPVSYIFCTDPIYKSLESSRKAVRKMNWPVFELKAGHNAMFTHPKETLNLLMKICN